MTQVRMRRHRTIHVLILPTSVQKKVNIPYGFSAQRYLVSSDIFGQ
jgi:hypothetical protein